MQASPVPYARYGPQAASVNAGGFDASLDGQGIQRAT
jgi:hypothetical protein